MVVSSNNSVPYEHEINRDVVVNACRFVLENGNKPVGKGKEGQRELAFRTDDFLDAIGISSNVRHSKIDRTVSNVKTTIVNLGLNSSFRHIGLVRNSKGKKIRLLVNVQ